MYDQQDSDEYHQQMAYIRRQKREQIGRKLKVKRARMERKYKRIQKVQDKYCEIPARISRIHVDGLRKTKDDVILYIPEIKNRFSQVRTFDDLISVIKTTVNKLSETGCFDDVKARIETDEHSPSGYEVIFYVEESLYYKNLGLVNNTYEKNQSFRLNPVVRIGIPNVFGRAEILEAEYGFRFPTCPTTRFKRLSFYKPFPRFMSDLTISMEHVNYPLGNPNYLLNDEKNLKIVTSFNLFECLSQSLSVVASWRRLDLASSKSDNFEARLESGHSLKTSLCYELLFDTTDDDLIPSSGIYLNSKHEVAGFTGDVNFVKSYFQLGIFYPLFSSISWSLHGSLGRISTKPDEKNNINCLDRFGLGGPLQIRGYMERGLGSYLGSNAFWAITSKLTFNLPFLRQKWITENVRPHVFLDLCNDKLEFVYGSRDIRTCVGIGTVFRIGSLGRAELNYCIPLQSKASDNSVRGLQCGIGIDFL